VNVMSILKALSILEEPYIEVELSALDLKEILNSEVHGNLRVVIVGRGRKRTVDLVILSLISRYCSNEFAQDYLNLDHSLDFIKKQYGCANELEFLSRCIEERAIDHNKLARYLSPDMVALLERYG
jgi:hypothetical protein